MSLFPDYFFGGSASDLESGIELVLTELPDLIFLEIEPENADSQLGLGLISELHRFLSKVPKVIVTARSTDSAMAAIKYGVFDYLVAPFRSFEVRKALMRLDRESVTKHEVSLPETTQTIPVQEFIASPDVQISQEIPVFERTVSPLIICVKSYGDYRFIEADQIQYLQADNNSTDIYLRNGEMVTAFKTLKHFESSLPKPFVRVHNSYIVNADLVTRIHTGTATFYLKETAVKIPFSKSYKENVDALLDQISGGNYLEV